MYLPPKNVTHIAAKSVRPIDRKDVPETNTFQTARHILLDTIRLERLVSKRIGMSEFLRRP